MNLNKKQRTTEKPLQPFVSLVSLANQKQYIQSCHDEHFLAQLPLICFPFKKEKEVCRAFEIEGQIDALGLKAHDIVLVIKVNNLTEITTDNVYQFITKKEMMIDLIYQNIKTKQCIVL